MAIAIKAPSDQLQKEEPRRIVMKALYDALSNGMIVHKSNCSIETNFFNPDMMNFTQTYNHEEVGFSIPYSKNYSADIEKIIRDILPEYDMVVWRVLPEASFARYIRPLRITWEFARPRFRSAWTEADIEYCGEEDAEIVHFYMRLSLGYKNKRVQLKIGESNG